MFLTSFLLVILCSSIANGVFVRHRGNIVHSQPNDALPPNFPLKYEGNEKVSQHVVHYNKGIAQYGQQIPLRSYHAKQNSQIRPLISYVPTQVYQPRTLDNIKTGPGPFQVTNKRLPPMQFSNQSYKADSVFVTRNVLIKHSGHSHPVQYEQIGHQPTASPSQLNQRFAKPGDKLNKGNHLQPNRVQGNLRPKSKYPNNYSYPRFTQSPYQNQRSGLSTPSTIHQPHQGSQYRERPTYGNHPQQNRVTGNLRPKSKYPNNYSYPTQSPYQNQRSGLSTPSTIPQPHQGSQYRDRPAYGGLPPKHIPTTVQQCGVNTGNICRPGFECIVKEGSNFGQCLSTMVGPPCGGIFGGFSQAGLKPCSQGFHCMLSKNSAVGKCMKIIYPATSQEHIAHHNIYNPSLHGSVRELSNGHDHTHGGKHDGHFHYPIHEINKLYNSLQDSNKSMNDSNTQNGQTESHSHVHTDEINVNQAHTHHGKNNNHSHDGENGIHDHNHDGHFYFHDNHMHHHIEPSNGNDTGSHNHHNMGNMTEEDIMKHLTEHHLVGTYNDTKFLERNSQAKNHYSHLLPPPTDSSKCDGSLNYHIGGDNYLVSAVKEGCKPMNWSEAVDFCHSKSMSMVSFGSSNNGIKAQNILDIARMHQDVGFWTGGFVTHPNNVRVPNTIVWLSNNAEAHIVSKNKEYFSPNSRLPYSNGQPDNYEYIKNGALENGFKEHCVAMMYNHLGNDGAQLHDLACYHKLYVVCEEKMPEPWGLNINM